MRYATLLFAFILLISTPVLAQEFSPIIVKTGDPTPSIVRTGEPFRVTYRAEFLDTVLIDEERMQPDNLALEKVEVIDLRIQKDPFDRFERGDIGFVNVWNFTYTFRIIQPEKGQYKVPAFNLIWVEKKAGTPEKDARENESPREFLTDEVAVNYVTSVVRPPKPKPLDIRDHSSFVSPVPSAYALRLTAYAVIVTASLLMLVVVFRFFIYAKISKSQDAVGENDRVMDGEATVLIEPVPPPKQARKNFLRDLKQLQDEKHLLSFMKKVRLSIRMLLLAECQGTVKNSMSENEIFVRLNELSDKKKKVMGKRHKPILALAQKLKSYKENIDSDNYSLDSGEEISNLRSLLLNLETSFFRRIWLRIRFNRRGR